MSALRKNRWGRSLVRISILQKPVRWTAARRLRLASVRDNEGTWYVCRSKRSSKDLERLFRQGEVAVLLLENIGGILGSPELWRMNKYVYIQIKEDLPQEVTDYVKVCLDEIGVEIVGPVAQCQITQP